MITGKMSKANPARLRLIVDGGIPAPRQRRKPEQKARRTNPRTLLLNTLREQQARIGSGEFARIKAPELYDLGMAADHVACGRRTFEFRGVRFGLKFGFRRYVVDLETGETLTAGKFLA